MLKIIPLRFGIKIPHTLASSNFWHSNASADDDQNLPRITCPKKLKEKFEHRQKNPRKPKLRPKGPLIISCKRKDYNFYGGQKTDAFNIQTLVSCGWKNTKRVGDHFTLVPHSENPSLQSDIDDTLSFKELGISERLCAGLQELGFKMPTEIQKYAIPSLLQGENVICAAETGSGKTLAYLIPTVEWILRQKHAYERTQIIGGSSICTNINTPNSVIITPNRELTHQVMKVAETLTPYADFVPYCIFGGHSTENLSRHKKIPMDLLVTTPGILRRFLTSKCIHSTNLQHLVIDESDTLLDDSFISEMQQIFQLLQVTPVEFMDSQSPYQGGTQIMLFSATMPRSVEDVVGNILSTDAMKKITTEGLHRLQPHVTQKFIRINPSSKPEQLIQLVKEKDSTTLVFANNNKTCYFLEKLLQQNGVNCLRLSGELNPDQRAGIFTKFKEGYSNVLVATDIMSRGLDTTNVQHVINYDFPTFMSDYIHRVGRVGRVGVTTAGHVTSFITYKWDVELLWKIETAARTKKKLDSVNANIKQLLKNSKAKTDEIELII